MRSSTPGTDEAKPRNAPSLSHRGAMLTPHGVFGIYRRQVAGAGARTGVLNYTGGLTPDRVLRAGGTIPKCKWSL
jgi:hypothetical protein